MSTLPVEFTATLERSPAKGGGDGRHKLPIKADLRAAIGKEAGARVRIRVDERL